MADGFEQSDIWVRINEGGKILGAFIVARSGEDFVIYLRPSWGRGRGFRLLRSWRGLSGDRTFKKLQSGWEFIQKFGFTGPITIYRSGDPALRHFAGVDTQDIAGDDQPLRRPYIVALAKPDDEPADHGSD